MHALGAQAHRHTRHHSNKTCTIALSPACSRLLTPHRSQLLTRQVAFPEPRLALITTNVGSFDPPSGADASWCAAARPERCRARAPERRRPASPSCSRGALAREGRSIATQALHPPSLLVACRCKKLDALSPQETDPPSHIHARSPNRYYLNQKAEGTSLTTAWVVPCTAKGACAFWCGSGRGRRQHASASVLAAAFTPAARAHAPPAQAVTRVRACYFPSFAGSAELKVTSATGPTSAFMDSSATLPVNPACAAATCAGAAAAAAPKAAAAAPTAAAPAAKAAPAATKAAAAVPAAAAAAAPAVAKAAGPAPAATKAAAAVPGCTPSALGYSCVAITQDNTKVRPGSINAHPRQPYPSPPLAARAAGVFKPPPPPLPPLVNPLHPVSLQRTPLPSIPQIHYSYGPSPPDNVCTRGAADPVNATNTPMAHFLYEGGDAVRGIAREPAADPSIAAHAAFARCPLRLARHLAQPRWGGPPLVRAPAQQPPSLPPHPTPHAHPRTGAGIRFQGWAAAGFPHKAGAMYPADVVLGWVNPDGTAKVRCWPYMPPARAPARRLVGPRLLGRRPRCVRICSRPCAERTVASIHARPTTSP